MKKIIAFVLAFCLLASVPVFAAESGSNLWGDKWELVKNASFEGDAIQINPDGDIKYNTTLGTNFECEFKLQIKGLNTSTKENGLSLASGSYRFYTVIKHNVIRYMPPDWSTARTWAEIPFNVGEAEHTYKFVVHGSRCELFVDGLFLADINIMSNTQTYQSFWSKDVTMLVRDFQAKSLPSLNVEAKEEVPVEPFFVDFNDGEDLSDWSISSGFFMHDGVMECIGVDSSAPGMTRKVGDAKEYVFEMRMKHPEYGYNGFSTYLDIGGYEVAFLINPNRSTDVRTKTAFAQGGEMVWGKDEWKVVKVETYDGGERAILSFDDVPYMDFAIRTTDYTESEIYIGGSQRIGATKATEFSIDWIRFEPKPAKDKIAVTMPMDGAEYLEGVDIELTAEVDASLDIPQVEYKLHGNTVAVGKAPDYKAVLQNVAPGNYDITAVYGDYESHENSFVVKKLAKVELKVESNDSLIKISPELYDELDRIAKVEYYVDGKLGQMVKKAPFHGEISGVTSATHSIQAKFYDKNGVIVCTKDCIYTPAVTDEQESVSYANDITYQVSGESGAAEVQVNNGRHSLVLKHSQDKVAYLTQDGMKEYHISSSGNWEILTDAYIADVYRNGQLLFSYLMPKTEEVGKSVTENGLNVTDFAVTIPEHKTNYFLQTNYAGNGMETYEISNLPYDYNLDFVASRTDNFRFAVSDGDFHLDFEFEDGKIWAQDIDNEGMDPKRRYQAEVPNTEGDIYYRAEVAGGFMRLYADGKWLTTVRMPRSSDSDALAIETNNTLKYISLCANEDLYLYEDNFDGSGENATLNYWELKETTATVNEADGYLSLEAAEGKEGRAEINASSGYAVVEATLDMSKCEGGAYILYSIASDSTEAKAGYNPVTKQFEIIRKNGNKETKLTADGKLDVSQPVKMRVELEQRRGGETAFFYINDELVLKDTESIKERGMVGLSFDGGVLQVDSFHYRGDGHPVISAKEWNTDLSTQYNMIEKENEWVLIDWQSKLRSTDFGETWTNETYTNTMESCHTVRLQSGAVLVAKRVWGTDQYGFRTTTYHSGISYDDGETWEEQGPIAEMAYAEATCNRLKQGPSGRVYFVTSRRGAHDDGWCRVYWSDDEGKTWKESIELGMSNIGHQCCEAEVIEMPDGEVRLYFRNETGMLIYITSNDRGETWDFTPHKTSILMPSTHYTIEQDPYDPNTFYAVYTYSNTNEHGRDQGPRCRLAVSVSYDGGNEWQFLGTLFEEEIEMFYATRGNDVTTMMNININVAKDHIIVTLPFNSESEASNRHWYLRVITLDKASVKALMKPEKLHTRPATIEQSAPVTKEMMERTLVVTSQGTKALVGGKLYENINHGNALPVDIVADFLGASVASKTERDVTFKQGDVTVKVDGDAVTSADGTTYVSIEAIAEKFNLYINREDELSIVGSYPKWSVEQVRTFKYAMNLFADSDREYVNTNINPEDTWESFLEYLETEYPKQLEKVK